MKRVTAPVTTIAFLSRNSNMAIRFGIVITFLCAISTVSFANQQPEEGESEERELAEGNETENRQGSTLFGGRDSIAVQLEDDDAIPVAPGRLAALDGAISGFGSWKQQLREDYGLQLAMDFATLTQSVSGSILIIPGPGFSEPTVVGRFATEVSTTPGLSGSRLNIVLR
jgi:hypothetical protein